jgi:hypothetical protein
MALEWPSREICILMTLEWPSREICILMTLNHSIAHVSGEFMPFPILLVHSLSLI